MQIDPRKEECFTACELARLVKTHFRIDRSHMSFRRWMRKGRVRQGKVIRLDSVDIGGQLCSSLEAFERFLERLNEEPD